MNSNMEAPERIYVPCRTVWKEYRTLDEDVEYIRADLHDEMKDELGKAERCIDTWVNLHGCRTDEVSDLQTEVKRLREALEIALTGGDPEQDWDYVEETIQAALSPSAPIEQPTTNSESIGSKSVDHNGQCTQEEWDKIEKEALQKCVEIVSGLDEYSREELDRWAEVMLKDVK